jgi:hypothetical protein
MQNELMSNRIKAAVSALLSLDVMNNFLSVTDTNHINVPLFYFNQIISEIANIVKNNPQHHNGKNPYMRIILLFLFFIPISVRAHEDMIVSLSKGNIHIEYKIGWTAFEIGNKVNILLDLAEMLVKEKGYTSEQMYIYFNHDYVKRNSPRYALGYGSFSYWDYENKTMPVEVKETGLKLIIRDVDIDIKKILNLINAAYKNIYSIQQQQQLVFIDLHRWVNGAAQYDTLSTMPDDIIKRYVSASDSSVEKLLQKKIPHNARSTQEYGSIDYYYQNNQFHFYDTTEPDTVWQRKDILVAGAIIEIIGSDNDGHFIFTNDSVFYYIPRNNETVSGPFTIDSVHAGRIPIQKYQHVYNPVEYFTFSIDDYRTNNKVAFFPGRNLVISNFDKLENKFIHDILENQKHVESNGNMMLYLILTALFLSIGLNVWLLSIYKSRI